ncbi:hypothetical protein JXQ70_01165 [bacterium]|nr:hypothetical protein [bacterium]
MCSQDTSHNIIAFFEPAFLLTLVLCSATAWWLGTWLGAKAGRETDSGQYLLRLIRCFTYPLFFIAIMFVLIPRIYFLLHPGSSGHGFEFQALWPVFIPTLIGYMGAAVGLIIKKTGNSAGQAKEIR